MNYNRILAATFNQQDIEKLRKDTLTLIKAIEKESSYDEARQVQQAISRYQKYIDDLFYKKMAPRIEDKSANKKFREVTWDFYISLGVPFWEPDEYHNKESRYRSWATDKTKWLNSVKRKARATWKVINEYFLELKESKEVDWKEPHQQSIEGFNVILEEEPANYTALKEGLKIAYESLNKVFPKALKRKPTLIFVRGGLDESGSYERYERKFIINLNVFNKYIKSPKQGARVIVHEIAHDIFQEYLSDNDTRYWFSAIRSDYGTLSLSELIDNWPDDMANRSLYWLGEHLIDKDPTLALKIQTLTMWREIDIRNRQDAKDALKKENTEYHIPKSPITWYANKNSEEAFCEAFSMYAVFGKRAVLPVVRMWLNTILPEANIVTGKIITVLEKVVAEYKLNKLLPTHPLFHATPAAVSILAHGEGLCSDKGSRFGRGNTKSISLSRDLTWLLDGKFGNAILVLDRDDLKMKYKIEPVDAKGYMSNYEYRKGELEERVYADTIPVKYIKAAILLIKPHKRKDGFTEFTDPKEWPQSVKYIYFNPKTKEIEVLN